jgi:hypothetical protein
MSVTVTTSDKTCSAAPIQTTVLPLAPAAPLREMEDVAKAIQLDTCITPEEYLDEVRVPCGGE